MKKNIKKDFNAEFKIEFFINENIVNKTNTEVYDYIKHTVVPRLQDEFSVHPKRKSLFPRVCLNNIKEKIRFTPRPSDLSHTTVNTPHNTISVSANQVISDFDHSLYTLPDIENNIEESN
jgi:hypothetical protein